MKLRVFKDQDDAEAWFIIADADGVSGRILKICGSVEPSNQELANYREAVGFGVKWAKEALERVTVDR